MDKRRNIDNLDNNHKRITVSNYLKNNTHGSRQMIIVYSKSNNSIRSRHIIEIDPAFLPNKPKRKSRKMVAK